MDRHSKKLLYDIQQSTIRIKEYTKLTATFDEFEKNFLVKRAVEREFEIIGEAMKRLLKIEPAITITQSRDIIDFRNRISHGYDTIDDAAIWEIIVEHLPKLKSEVDKLLT